MNVIKFMLNIFNLIEHVAFMIKPFMDAIFYLAVYIVVSITITYVDPKGDHTNLIIFGYILAGVTFIILFGHTVSVCKKIRGGWKD